MAARRYLHVGGASQPAVHVVAANLHIVCGTSPPKVTVRQHIVKQLRVFLEEFTAPTAGMPIGRLIVGDDNLSTREAKEALQQVRETDPLWEVYSAMKQGKGDHVAVSGATAMFIPIAVGKNFHNRGMRCDQHDALCVQLSVPGASQPVKEAADQEAECKGWYPAGAALTNTWSDEPESQLQPGELPRRIDSSLQLQLNPEAQAQEASRALQQQEALGQRRAEQPASARALEQRHHAYRLLQEAVGSVRYIVEHGFGYITAVTSSSGDVPDATSQGSVRLLSSSLGVPVCN